MKSICTVVLICLLAAAVAGDSGDGGTESVFSFGAGARELALGGAAIANADAATSPFWNPSRLAQAEQFAMTGFYMRLFDSDASYQYLGCALPTMDYGSFGVGVFRLGVGGINVRDASNVDLGETQEERLALYLSYAKNVWDYDLGAAVTLQYQSLADYSATSSPGLNLSLGRSFDVGYGWLDRLSLVFIGTNLLRPQTKLVSESVTYPMGGAAGLAADIRPGGNGNHWWTVSASVRKVDYADPRLSVGVEYHLYGVLHLRGGLHEGRSSIGMGIGTDLIDFDYAMVDRELGTLHTFTLTTSLGKPITERRRLRAERQEAEFNRRMADQFKERNRATIAQLTSEGRALLAESRVAEALQSFDRALFLSHGTETDTSSIQQLADSARTRLEESRRAEQLASYVDSAQSAYAAQNFVVARFWAGQVLDLNPNQPEASRILADANKALQQSAAHNQLVSSELHRIDSLLNYGHSEAALTAARSLREYAPGNPSVQAMLDRTQLEHLKTQASDAFSEGDMHRARILTDSALTKYPSHQWFTEMSKRLDGAARRAYSAETTTQPVTAPPALSAELRKQVEAIYTSARDAYQSGDLRGAIAGWEKVDALAPNYASVRQYLVSAYKFVGVECYGRNQLAEAVEAWKAAQRLDPASSEISEYIRRAEGEMRKLKELSYEP